MIEESRLRHGLNFETLSADGTVFQHRNINKLHE